MGEVAAHPLEPQDCTRAGAAAALPLLDEARALEDLAWPPVRRRPAVRAAAAIAAAQGDAARALQLGRELLQLGLAAGDPSPMTRINLVDAELAAANAAAALAAGRELLAWLEHQRDDNHLTYARLNVAAAWLALDRLDEAEALLRACWAGAARLRRLDWWCDHAALLAALLGRPADAARLRATADVHYAAAGEGRQANEAREHARTQALLGEGTPAAAPLADEALVTATFGTGPHDATG